MADAFQKLTFQTDAFETGPIITILTAEATSYSITGNSTSLEVGGKLTGLAGTYTLTGSSARLERFFRVISNVGSFAFTGQNVTFSVGKTMFASSGSYSVSGQVANLKQTHVEPFAPAFYPVTGQNARLARVYTLNASYVSGERVFEEGSFQEDFIQSYSSQNDIKLLGREAYATYSRSGTQVYVVV